MVKIYFLNVIERAATIAAEFIPNGITGKNKNFPTIYAIAGDGSTVKQQ